MIGGEYNIPALPPAALRPLALWYRRMAEKLEDAADDHDRHAHELQRLEDRRHAVAGIADIVSCYMESGQSLGQALTTAEKLTGLDPDAIQAILPKVRAKRQKKTTAKRYRRIMALYHEGLTNREISAVITNPKTGRPLHEKSVARIIAENLDLSKKLNLEAV